MIDIKELWNKRACFMNGYSLNDFLGFLGVDSLDELDSMHAEDLQRLPGIVRNHLSGHGYNKDTGKWRVSFYEWNYQNNGNTAVTRGREWSYKGDDANQDSAAIEDSAAIYGLFTFFELYFKRMSS